MTTRLPARDHLYRCLRHSVQALLLGLAMLNCSLASAQDEPVFSFGIVPQFEARKLADVWVPLLREVGTRAGVKLRMVGAPRIPDFEQSFAAGDFDFAYMNPYHAVLALRTQGYTPLVRDGERKLFGILVVRADSEIYEVADLDGARIAFPAPNALGASLMVRADLSRRLGLNYQAIYAQTHSSSYLNVLLGKSDAAGGVRSTLDQQSQSYRDNLRVIYETQRMPAHPVVAHPRVPVEVAMRVGNAFIELGQTDIGRALLKQVPMMRPVAASIEDYAPVEALNLEEFFVPMSGELVPPPRM